MNFKDMAQELQGMDPEELRVLARALAPLVKAVVTDILHHMPAAQTHSPAEYVSDPWGKPSHGAGWGQNAVTASFSGLADLKKFFDNCNRRHG